MKMAWLGSIFLTLLLFGCRKPMETAVDSFASGDGGPTHALAKLPTIKLWLGPQELAAEIARTPLENQTGMMFRTNMAEMDAMLFVLPYTQQASFWMKNCVVPLSVAYIDPEGVIQEIHDLQPGNTNPVSAASPQIRFALEVSQGWFNRHQISSGAVVRTERGSLAETFLGRR